MPYPTPVEFTIFLDANPVEYKNNPEADSYNSTQDIADQLVFRPEIANPNPQEDVPKPLTIADLQALLTSESIEVIGRVSDSWWAVLNAYITGTQTLAGLSGTRDDAIAMVNAAESRANITPAEAILLRDEINSKIPDPDYQTTVLGDSDAKTEWNLDGISHSFINTSLGRV